LADIAATILHFIIAGFGVVFAIAARGYIRGKLRRLRGLV
jgi:hypothetical protein